MLLFSILCKDITRIILSHLDESTLAILLFIANENIAMRKYGYDMYLYAAERGDSKCLGKLIDAPWFCFYEGDLQDDIFTHFAKNLCQYTSDILFFGPGLSIWWHAEITDAAIRSGSYESIVLLLRNGFYFSSECCAIAEEYEHDSIFELFVRLGRVPEMYDIHEAIHNEDYESLKYYKKRGYDIKKLTKQYLNLKETKKMTFYAPLPWNIYSSRQDRL